MDYTGNNTRNNFNTNHPELRKGETFITNVSSMDYITKYKTDKRYRIGCTAYDVNGRAYKAGTPVFLKKEKVECNKN